METITGRVTMKAVEASELKEGMVTRLLGQDWVIHEILDTEDGVDLFLQKLTSGNGVEVYAAYCSVPFGLVIPVYI